MTKSEQDIANERTDLRDKLDELTMTQAQLAEKARNKAEATAKDATVQGIINVWHNHNAVDGSHRDGLERVPFDGHVAELHQGERVQTASQVRDGDAATKRTNELLKEVANKLDESKRAVRAGAAT